MSITFDAEEGGAADDSADCVVGGGAGEVGHIDDRIQSSVITSFQVERQRRQDRLVLVDLRVKCEKEKMRIRADRKGLRPDLWAADANLGVFGDDAARRHIKMRILETLAVTEPFDVTQRIAFDPAGQFDFRCIVHRARDGRQTFDELRRGF